MRPIARGQGSGCGHGMLARATIVESCVRTPDFPCHYDLPAQIHASCVCYGGQGLLIRGPSGAGKSDLTIQLIERGAGLVADDLVLVSKQGDQLLAAAPVAGRGLIELRGQGIYKWPHQENAILALVVDLVAPAAMQGQTGQSGVTFGSHSLRKVHLPRHAASNTARLRILLEGQAIGQTVVIGGHG